MVDEMIGRLDIFSAARLKRVCKPWARAVATHPSLPFGRPCLLMSRDDEYERAGLEPGEDDDCTFGLLDISAGTTATLTALRDRWCVGARGDWLATVDADCNGQLLNPYTGEQIDLPAFATIPGVEPTGSCGVARGQREYKLRKMVVCETPSGGGYLVAAVFGGALLAVARGGDRSWTALKNPDSGRLDYGDAIVHKGKVFAVHGALGDVYAWDLRAGGEPETVRPPRDDGGSKYEWNLAESADGGRLLLVCTYGRHVPDWKLSHKYGRGVDAYDAQGVKLYELDGEGWSAVPGLFGRRSLFLGVNYPFWAGVDRRGSSDERRALEPNCVYFAVHHVMAGVDSENDLVKFDLERREMEGMRLFNSNRYYDFQAPVWFIPTLQHGAR